MTSMEDDVKQMMRQYQYLEHNRKEYAKDAANTIARQQKMIEMLKSDNERLKSEYRNLMTRPKASANESMLAELQDKADAFRTKMEAEKKTLSELRSQQKLMQDKILDLRKKMGGVNAARENQRMVNKQVKILENRLDKALVRFNEALSENKRLRQEIDNLRRERVVFDNIYRKLERELHEKKRQMANTIEMSNQAYEARDQAQIEVAAIEQTNAKEQSDFEAQMSQLEESIKEEKERRAALLEGEEDESLTRGDLTPEEEDKLKQNVTQTAWSMARDKASIQVSMEKVQSYEEAWTKIKAATGIQDINELVRIFIANEDQNFSLFNYVREQNSEVEKLEEQIAELREEEARHAQEGGGDASQHKQLLQDLESKLEATNAAAQKFESKFQDAQKTINALKLGIQSLFSKVEADTTGMSELLAGEAVTDNNLMQYMGLVEQRTNEILQAWALLRQKDQETGRRAEGEKEGEGDEAKGEGEEEGAGEEEEEGVAPAASAMVKVLGAGPTAPTGEGTRLAIQAPSMEDYSDAEDGDSDTEGLAGGGSTVPHRLDQIKAEVLRHMSMKGAPDAATPSAAGGNGNGGGQARQGRGRAGGNRRR